jgi:small-conductance mechanosensitive channel
MGRSLPRFLVFLLLALGAACSASLTPTATSTPIPAAEGQETDVTATPEAGKEKLVVTPTLAPTATPDTIAGLVSEIASATGIGRWHFLGLSGEDWINLAASALLVLLGIAFGGRVVYYLLRQLAKITATPYDEQYVTTIETQIKWFVGVLALQFATGRLEILSPESKQWLDQLYFALYVLVVTVMLWKLIDFGSQRFQKWADSKGEGEEFHSFLTLIQRALLSLLLIIAATILLNNYGVNVTMLVAVLGLSGLALTLAGQSILVDAVSGFLILMDRPFHVGDRIGIEAQDTLGIVNAIGTRTTRLLTDDNLVVVVPNSTIVGSQVTNYTHPDPRFRQQTEIGVGYDSDVKIVEDVIRKAVRGVEGVLPDQSVQVLFRGFGASALKIQVRWWIASYENAHNMDHSVHKAILAALNQAEIEIPYNVYDVRLDRRGLVRPVTDEQ